jgi:hypothetical protein
MTAACDRVTQKLKAASGPFGEPTTNTFSIWEISSTERTCGFWRTLMKNNLLTALHRWASRQDENFITDAFAHLLRHLLADDAAVGRKLLQFLTDEKFSVGSNNGSIQVKTQVTLAQGRPDIEISSECQLVYVEAKVESGLGDRQLERYVIELLPDDGIRWHIGSLKEKRN